MNGKLLHILILFLLIGASPVRAQTFAPSSGVAAENSGYVRPEKPGVANTVTQKANPNLLKPELVAEPRQVNKDEEELLKPASSKIEKKKPEEKYDNSVGKVMEFKFVNGKMVFAEDDDRKILVSYENFNVERGMDNMVRCTMRIFVLNDMKDRLGNLSIKLKWPEISTSVQMVHVNPGVKTYVDTMLLGKGCLSMDKTPTIEVNRCRIKGKTEEQCANAVRWFQKNQ